MAGIRDIAAQIGVKTIVITELFETIFRMVRSGETVRITGFGSFDKRTFAGRTVKSGLINDGRPTTFGPTVRIAFKQSLQAKRRMNAPLKKKSKKAEKRKKGSE